jgi:PST family polysaccharide transporter
VGRSGGALGIVWLGYYGLAYTWGNRVVVDVAHVFTRVVFPALARVRGIEERFRAAFLVSLQQLALVVYPACVGLLCLAPEFIALVLGEKWLPATAALQLWCICAMSRTLGIALGNAFHAAGYPKVVMYSSSVFLLVAVPLAIVLTPWLGISGAALAFLCASLLTSAFLIALASSRLGIRAGQLLRRLLPPSGCAAVMGVVLLVVTYLFTVHRLWQLIVLILLGGLIYTFCSLLWQRQELRQVWVLLVRRPGGGAES